jgi:kynureninase
MTDRNPDPITRERCLALDARDPLAAHRARFVLPPGLVYLDGNSLGPLPQATAQRVREVIEHEWGQELIRAWNSADWLGLPQRVGDKIAQLIGAAPGEVIVTDSTSINLHKVLAAAITIARDDSPGRNRIVSERSNFPTDLYIAESLAAIHGFELVLCDAAELPALLDERVAILMLTHVDYRTGRMHDMTAITRRAHQAGALVVWDLAHSAGAVPVDLHAARADFAVGCGYKYLNGGPGAPAFVWVAPQHLERAAQPLAGWMGHARPFEFETGYRPAPGIQRYLSGTPSAIALAALECGVDTVLSANMSALREKSLSLTGLFIELVKARCAGHGLSLVTPQAPPERGSQVCFARSEGAYAIVQALIARGVIGDFRAPDILRFGFAPLYLSHTEVWDAVEHLAQVLESGEWREERFSRMAAVT